MILLLDNYDSFVFNLDRYLQQLGHETLVVRSDAIGVDSIERTGFAAIVISPGPKAPDQAGSSLEVIRRLHRRVPILGVCLGHQAIAQAFGGRVVRSDNPLHGMATTITHDGSALFDGLPRQLTVGRYHSLVAEPESLPACLEVNATSDDGHIMALRHRELPIFGLQFHPESILTEGGHRMLQNFLAAAGLPVRGEVPEPDWDIISAAGR